MIPFLAPGSKALAETVVKGLSMGKPCALLLQNHGLLVVGKTFQEVLNISEEIDEAARIFVLTSGKAQIIPREELDKI